MKASAKRTVRGNGDHLGDGRAERQKSVSVAENRQMLRVIECPGGPRRLGKQASHTHGLAP